VCVCVCVRVCGCGCGCVLGWMYVSVCPCGSLGGLRCCDVMWQHAPVRLAVCKVVPRRIAVSHWAVQARAHGTSSDRKVVGARVKRNHRLRVAPFHRRVIRLQFAVRVVEIRVAPVHPPAFYRITVSRCVLFHHRRPSLRKQHWNVAPTVVVLRAVFRRAAGAARALWQPHPGACLLVKVWPVPCPVEQETQPAFGQRGVQVQYKVTLAARVTRCVPGGSGAQQRASSARVSTCSALQHFETRAAATSQQQQQQHQQHQHSDCRNMQQRSNRNHNSNSSNLHQHAAA
jgi:hypothetical protein